MTNVYVLQLEENKYYVGRTINVEKRFQEHKSGCSAWTRRYPPLEIIKEFKNVSNFEEDMITKQYMYKYGINNVRGGSYVRLSLTKAQVSLLTQEIRFACNLCAFCGRNDHFIKDCKAVASRSLEPSITSTTTSDHHEEEEGAESSPSITSTTTSDHHEEEEGAESSPSITSTTTSDHHEEEGVESSPSITSTATSDHHEKEEGAVSSPLEQLSVIVPGITKKGLPCKTCISLISQGKSRCSNHHHAQVLEETTNDTETVLPGITRDGKQCIICISMISRMKGRCHLHKGQGF
jgi:predicted GIY-YIG superfamily endonuclease